LPVPDHRDHCRRLANTLATAVLSGPRPALRHDGACGERARCPRCPDRPTRGLERLRNGYILVHCCLRETLRPSDRRYAEFAAAFE
jgi:hypothetical protein